MNRCRACQAANPEVAKFCMACGTPVVTAPPVNALRFVTVAFCDISGSTQLALRFDPEVWHSILEMYFSEVGAALAEAGGRLEKFIGDAVVAVFGVDTARGDEATSAVRGALSALSRLRQVNQDSLSRHGITLSIRFGIASGRVVTAERSSSFAIGSVMNAAARLQAAAPPDGAVIDVRTWLLVRDQVSCTPVPPVAAKGFARPLQAWAVSGDRPLPESEPVFVNQADLYDQLRGAVTSALAGDGPAVIGLEGEPGSGKTRVLRRLATELLGHDLPDPGNGGSPAGPPGRPAAATLPAAAALPVARAAHTFLLDCEGDPEEEALWQVQQAELAILGRGNSDATTATPSLAEFQWRIGRRLAEAARTGSVAVLVDGYERASAALRAALRSRPGTDHPVVFVLAGRQVDSEVATRLRVPPLSDDHAVELLGALADDIEVHSVATEPLVRRACGNPLFLEQLAALAASGIDDEVAPSAEAALGARIDRLSSTARHVLACVGAWGRVVAPHDVEAVCDYDAAAVNAAFDELAAAGMVEHRVAAEVAYGRLVLSEQARVHTSIAHRLLEYASRDPVRLDLAVAHALRAHQRWHDLAPGSAEESEGAGLATQSLLAAARFAILRSDNRAAADLAVQARELAGADEALELEIASVESYALAVSGQVPAALERIRSVADRSGNPSATVHIRITELSLGGGMAQGVRELVDQVGDPCARARLETWEGIEAARNGDYPRAEALLESAYATLSQFRVGLGVAEVYGNLSLFIAYGDTPLDRAVARCRALRDEVAGAPLLHAAVNCGYALLHQFQGDSAAALAILEGARPVFVGLDHVFGEAGLYQFVATVNELAGDLRAAVAALAKAGAIYNRAGAGGSALRCLLRAYVLDPDGPAPELPPAEQDTSWGARVLRHQVLASAGGKSAAAHLAEAERELAVVRGRARLAPEAASRRIADRLAGR